MEYGHWVLLCEELNDWESFVYEIIDENDKRYIGAKTRIKGWEKYKSSCKPLKKAIAGGLVCRFTILKFFSTKHEAFDYEDELLLKYNCVKSELYWNRCRQGKEFNTAGDRLSDEKRDNRKGENNPLFKGWYVINGVKYATVKAASKDLGCDPTTISYRTESESFPEYIFIDALTLKQKSKRITKKRHKKGKNHPKFKGWYVIHGVQYTTLKEAATALGCRRVTILNRTNSDKFPEYTFLPVSDMGIRRNIS